MTSLCGVEAPSLLLASLKCSFTNKENAVGARDCTTSPFFLNLPKYSNLPPHAPHPFFAMSIDLLCLPYSC